MGCFRQGLLDLKTRQLVTNTVFLCTNVFGLETEITVQTPQNNKPEQLHNRRILGSLLV